MTDRYMTANRLADRAISRVVDALPLWMVSICYFFSRKRPIT